MAQTAGEDIFQEMIFLWFWDTVGVLSWAIDYIKPLPVLNTASINSSGLKTMYSNYTTWGKRYLATPPHRYIYPGKSMGACGYLLEARGGSIDSDSASSVQDRLGLMQSTGSWTVLRERKSPIGLKTKLGHQVYNTAALLSHSATLIFFPFFPFSPLEKWCYAQKGSRFTQCLKRKNRLKAGSFTFERHCLNIAAAAEQPESDEAQLWNRRSCERRRLDRAVMCRICRFCWTGARRGTVISALASLWRVCSGEISALNWGRHGNLESCNMWVDWCWPVRLLSAAKSGQISRIISDLRPHRVSEKHAAPNASIERNGQ